MAWSSTSPNTPEHGKCKENLVFRKLGRADARHMAELECLCFSLPWSLPQCEAAFCQKAFAAFGLFRKAHLVAYISIYHTAPEMEILNVAVEPASRRMGHGKRILHMVLQVARKMGMQRVSLEVRQSNLAALALYKAAGFVTVGRRARYYPDTGEDALIQEYTFKFVP